MELKWDPTMNLHAYQDVEAPVNYPSREVLESYRALLLEKSQAAADCIRAECFRGEPLDVLEICSGSSRLLYKLDQLWLVAQATGVEVSPSRHQFAEDWKRDLATTRVRNINKAADQYSFDCGAIDVAVMIDGALSYLYPCDPQLPEKVLKSIHGILNPGGKVILEFDVLSEAQRGSLHRDGAFRIWKAGDEKDVFRYALYETRIMDRDQMVVQNCSIYLHRNDGSERIKREMSKIYRPEELDALLSRIGFRVSHYCSFAHEPFAADSAALVTIAEKY